MNQASVHPPLSNIQLELLKLFPNDIPENNLSELRNIMARYLMDKARDKADDIWEHQGYTDEKLQNLLKEE